MGDVLEESLDRQRCWHWRSARSAPRPAQALTLVPPKPDILFGVSDQGTTQQFNEFTELLGQAPGAAGDLPPLGQQPQPGLRTLARNRDAADPRDLDDRRPDAGRADHARADRARRRRRLPAAAQRLLRQTRAARLHQAAGRAQPLPQRLVGGQLRRQPEGRRTHRPAGTSRPSAASPRSSAAARPWKGSTRPWPKSACRRSIGPRARTRPNCRRRR